MLSSKTLILLLVICSLAVAYENELIEKPKGYKPVVLTELKKLDNVPTSFDWSNVNGVNYLTVTKN